MQSRIAYIAVLVALLAVASVASAFDALVDRLPRTGRASELFDNRQVSAQVKDGYLIGRGFERSRVYPDGRLYVERMRRYTRVEHPKSRKRFALTEPWVVRSTLLLSPSLRLIETETHVQFHRSIDQAMGYPFSEKFEQLFEWNRAHTVASRGGTKLTRTLTHGKRVVERDTYDYPRDAIPLEIVGLVVAQAVNSRVAEFEFDLLMPGGERHGVHSRVHRTRDVTRFAKGYPLPAKKLAYDGELAVVDMWLASPIKRVFFPHHFYLVYASADPGDIIAVWGGDPDETLTAFRD